MSFNVDRPYLRQIDAWKSTFQRFALGTTLLPYSTLCPIGTGLRAAPLFRGAVALRLRGISLGFASHWVSLASGSPSVIYVSSPNLAAYIFWSKFFPFSSCSKFGMNALIASTTCALVKSSLAKMHSRVAKNPSTSLMV